MAEQSGTEADCEREPESGAQPAAQPRRTHRGRERWGPPRPLARRGGIASYRPYAYWVWANLAALVACAGPAAAVVLRRAVVAGLHRRHVPAAVYLLPIAAAVAILGADLSGLSKSEVERIWLPFAVWLLAGAALLPPASRRGWLAVQAGAALLVNHLLLTAW